MKRMNFVCLHPDLGCSVIEGSMFKQSLIQPSLKEAAAIAIAVVALMSVAIIAWQWMPQMVILLAIVALVCYGRVRKVRIRDMQNHMTDAVSSGMGAIYLFFFIGLLVSALMMSGAIPTLMSYSLGMISPDYFYVVAFVITAIIGMAIGSSLTTCATLGVAFIGMTDVFGANPAITAGAIVSGAFFGDKMSPISDTTGIAASIVGIDLFEHIRNMAYTTIPAFIISIGLYGYLSGHSSGSDVSAIQVYQQQLQATGLIHGYALLPFLVLLVLALRKVDAIPTMFLTILSAIAVTYVHSSPSMAQLGQYFFSGFKLEQDLGSVNALVTRGGLESMFFVQTVVILALSLGGLLFALGVIPALLAGMQHFLRNAARATFSVAATAVGVNVLIGEQYLSLLLAGNTFKPVYERLHLHPRNLSRTLEDAGTVINPLVPWSVCGVFISHTLHVSVWAYLPFAFFCYLSLLLTLAFGFSGLTISKTDGQP